MERPRVPGAGSSTLGMGVVRAMLTALPLHDAGRPAYEEAKRCLAQEIVLSQGYAPPPAPSHEAGGLSLLIHKRRLRGRGSRSAAVGSPA